MYFLLPGFPKENVISLVIGVSAGPYFYFSFPKANEVKDFLAFSFVVFNPNALINLSGEETDPLSYFFSPKLADTLK